MRLLWGEYRHASEGGKWVTVPVWYLLLVRWYFISNIEQFI